MDVGTLSMEGTMKRSRKSGLTPESVNTAKEGNHLGLGNRVIHVLEVETGHRIVFTTDGDPRNPVLKELDREGATVNKVLKDHNMDVHAFVKTVSTVYATIEGMALSLTFHSTEAVYDFLTRGICRQIFTDTQRRTCVDAVIPELMYMLQSSVDFLVTNTCELYGRQLVWPRPLNLNWESFLDLIPQQPQAIAEALTPVVRKYPRMVQLKLVERKKAPQ